jgi:sulfur-oxidizing protein SoxX
MKKTFAFIPAVITALLFATGPLQAADKAKVDYTKMTPEELAEYLIFDAKGFKLDMDVQEGGKAKGRMVQDDLQKACTQSRNKPTPEQAGKILADARASIKYPEGGIKLGDWKKGRELAWSGFGYRVGHRIDDHAKREPGGNCYNCHQLATDRVGGTIGPSLTNYGKNRGKDEQTLRFVYDMIYNAHAYFPCTRMPRMGAKGLLSPEQISDVMAYLLDPESPVNH